MAGPLYELQVAIVAALKADAAVAAIVGGRVLDGRPEVYPALTIGPSDALPDDYQCIPGLIVTLQIDAWVRDGSRRLHPVYALTEAVRAALHDRTLSLATHALALMRVEQIRHFRDPDGVTQHGVIVLTAQIELR